MAYASTDQASFDMDLCSLLQTMKLDERQEWGNVSDSRNCPKAEVRTNEGMMVEDLNYQSSDEGSECSIPNSSILAPVYDAPSGCAYLQMLRSQIDEHQSTGGEYVEAIFTHREIFSAHPAVHRDCARGFTDLAAVLEKRAWQADWESNPNTESTLRSETEAVSAFRYEAWVIANAIPHQPKATSAYSQRASSVCMMPPAY